MASPAAFLAVVPTVLLAGPAALLAALCPAVFAALAVFWRRWGILLAVLSLNSSLVLAHAWLRGYGGRAWWATPRALWACLALVAGTGAVLSFWRARRLWRSGQAAAAKPGRLVLTGFVAAGALGLAACWHALQAGVLWRWPWRECLPLTAAVWAGALNMLAALAAYRWRPALAALTEGAMLAGLAAGCLVVAAAVGPPAAPEVVWTFEAVDRGLVLSSPRVDGDRVYVAAAHASGFKLSGAVYCLDRATGKRIWSFSKDGRMKQVCSSPALADGRLYIGEGLHEDADCRLFCLDARTGRELWSFVTRSHTESSPRLANGCVFFGAGEDGVYCLDAATGAERWHFPGLHVDTAPTVVDNRLYAGSAYGASEMFCLDADTGRPLWRTPSDLSVLSAAAVADGRVFFGVGNGKLTGSNPTPAGALVCLDAATGQKLWRHDVADAVLSSPALAGDFVLFGSRDGHCYCLSCKDGERQWRKDLGSPVVASPVLSGAHLYVLGSAGSVYCLQTAGGNTLWQFDVGKYSRTTPEMVSTPALVIENTGPRLYVGAGLDYSINTAAIVYCLKAPAENPH